MAKKLLVLKPLRLRNLNFLLSFSYYNFEDTALKTNNDDDMFIRKKLSVLQTLIVKRKPNFKMSLFVFNYLTVFSFCLLFILTEKCLKLSKPGFHQIVTSS